VAQPQRVLFVTGRLAEPALRRVVADIANIEPVVAVLPISVAALLTTEWIGRHLPQTNRVDRVILPGLCRGDLTELADKLNTPLERGPADLNELPEYLGGQRQPPATLDRYDIEIIAEINNAPQLSQTEILNMAQRFKSNGADVIDLGCDPGGTWTNISDIVKLLRDHGYRVSVDSFNIKEIAAAAKAGAELVLSVNSSNLAGAGDWGCEVVAIPDTPSDLGSLDRTVAHLDKKNVLYRLDSILEPISFGFSASVGRYLDVRRRYPHAQMMLGIANLTELTEVDSAGINLVFMGFCQEQRILSVLTTEVANWCRNCIQELDLARRIAYVSAQKGVLPKGISPALVQLRDARLRPLSEAAINELAQKINDRNYRIFTEPGVIHVINGFMHLRGDDPFLLLREIQDRDPKLTPDHAFYLGYELSKAVTAMTLGKNYVQDQALRWGLMTREEHHHA
jgi:dihydropteroate synthase-like protein